LAAGIRTDPLGSLSDPPVSLAVAMEEVGIKVGRGRIRQTDRRIGIVGADF